MSEQATPQNLGEQEPVLEESRVEHDEAERQEYSIKDDAEVQGVTMRAMADRVELRKRDNDMWRSAFRGRDAVSTNTEAYRATHHQNSGWR